MKNEEVQKIVDKRIKRCKVEKAKENVGTVVKTACSFGSFGVMAMYISRYFPEVKYPAYFFAIVMGYSLVTLDYPLSFEYSNKKYLDFLKEISNDLKNNKNKFQEVDEETFENELNKVYRLNKNFY